MKLGLAIVDEQHRFGVLQRGDLTVERAESSFVGHDRHAHPPHIGYSPTTVIWIYPLLMKCRKTGFRW